MRVLNSPFLTEFKVFYQLSVCGQTENQQKAIQNKVTKPFVEVLYVFLLYIFKNFVCKAGTQFIAKENVFKTWSLEETGSTYEQTFVDNPGQKIGKRKEIK